jgi:hypothetical protein
LGLQKLRGSHTSQLCRLVAFGSAALEGSLEASELRACWDSTEGGPVFTWRQPGSWWNLLLPGGIEIARSPLQWIRFWLESDCSKFEVCYSMAGDEVIPDSIQPYVGSYRFPAFHRVEFVQLTCPDGDKFFAAKPRRSLDDRFRISLSRFVGTPAKTRFVQPITDVAMAGTNLREAMAGVDRFFQDHGAKGTLKAFEVALEQFEAPEPRAAPELPYPYETIVPQSHPLPARRLIAAGDTAGSVISGGGMGTWFDRFYPGDEQARFLAVSNALSHAAFTARVVGVNAK